MTGCRRNLDFGRQKNFHGVEQQTVGRGRWREPHSRLSLVDGKLGDGVGGSYVISIGLLAEPQAPRIGRRSVGVANEFPIGRAVGKADQYEDDGHTDRLPVCNVRGVAEVFEALIRLGCVSTAGSGFNLHGNEPAVDFTGGVVPEFDDAVDAGFDGAILGIKKPHRERALLDDRHALFGRKEIGADRLGAWGRWGHLFHQASLVQM